MNSAILKFINEKEPLLRRVVEAQKSDEVVWMGRDLLLAGYGDGNYDHIKHDQKYVIDRPVWVFVDHKKRMKKLYHKHGMKAVKKYVDENII